MIFCDQLRQSFYNLELLVYIYYYSFVKICPYAEIEFHFDNLATTTKAFRCSKPIASDNFRCKYEYLMFWKLQICSSSVNIYLPSFRKNICDTYLIIST